MGTSGFDLNLHRKCGRADLRAVLVGAKGPQNGLLASSTIELAILPNVPPITTPSARSITLPLFREHKKVGDPWPSESMVHVKSLNRD